MFDTASAAPGNGPTFREVARQFALAAFPARGRAKTTDLLTAEGFSEHRRAGQESRSRVVGSRYVRHLTFSRS
jgi:hypothetical protein